MSFDVRLRDMQFKNISLYLHRLYQKERKEGRKEGREGKDKENEEVTQ